MSDSAFAALLSDGSVISWGGAGTESRGAGDIGPVADQLKSDVVKIIGHGGGFAALKKDGSLVVWGDQYTNLPNDFQKNYLNKNIIDLKREK